MSDPDLCIGNPLFFVMTYVEHSLHYLVGNSTAILWSLSGNLEVWQWSLPLGAFCRLPGVMA